MENVSLSNLVTSMDSRWRLVRDVTGYCHVFVQVRDRQAAWPLPQLPEGTRFSSRQPLAGPIDAQELDAFPPGSVFRSGAKIARRVGSLELSADPSFMNQGTPPRPLRNSR